MTRADVYCPLLRLPTGLGLLNKLDLTLTIVTYGNLAIPILQMT